METESKVIPVDQLLSVRQASNRYGVSRRTLYYWIEIGKVRRFTVGDSLYVHCEDIAPYARRSA